MKRRIALLLSLMLLVAALLPVNALAADNEGLDQAIRAAKSKITIPSNYTFSYYHSYLENGKRMWSLEWNADGGVDGSIYLTIDEKGNIWHYSNYKYLDYSERKLPKVSRDQAKEIAEKFIKKVNTVVASQIDIKDEYTPNIMDRTYYLRFHRVVNGVPFEENGVSVEVDRQTGDIVYFYSNWIDNLVFPEPKETIGIEKAQEAYMDQLGLRLEYRYYTKDNVMNLFAVYAPKFTDMYIDAFTGEKVDLSYEWAYYAAGGRGDSSVMYSSEKSVLQDIKLSPEEEDAIARTSDLISSSKLEKDVRALDFLGLTDEFELVNDNLYSDWNDKNNFTRYFYFLRRPTNEKEGYRTVEVSLDAKTGEIKSFYISEPRDQDTEAKFDKEASKAAVEAFIKKMAPDKFDQTVYDESSTIDFIPLAENDSEPKDYSFRYLRKVGEAVFPSNSIYASYDAVSGKITGYSVTWFDVEFPSLEDAISMEDAYGKLFEEVGLELVYKLDYSYEYFLKNYGREAKPEVKLVYDLIPGKPALFDAFTGEVVDYMGQPYKKFSIPEYTDIDGTLFENQIRILAENGVFLEGTEFKPNDNIKQKDFFLLFSKVMRDYWYDPSAPEADQLEQLYIYLLRQGIVKAEEKDPEAYVSREDAVKFIIRALNYDEVADIKGIFVSKFKDVDAINPDLVGYVAIASGLNIISGDANGNFNPKNLMTRGQMAALIYNYLQR